MTVVQGVVVKFSALKALSNTFPSLHWLVIVITKFQGNCNKLSNKENIKMKQALKKTYSVVGISLTKNILLWFVIRDSNDDTVVHPAALAKGNVEYVCLKFLGTYVIMPEPSVTNSLSFPVLLIYLFWKFMIVSLVVI